MFFACPPQGRNSDLALVPLRLWSEKKLSATGFWPPRRIRISEIAYSGISVARALEAGSTNDGDLRFALLCGRAGGSAPVELTKKWVSRTQIPPEQAAHVAASNCQLPGTPFRLWATRSSNRRPDPATRSLTVLDTKTSSGAARAPILAPICTAIPPSFSPITSHSPV